MNTVETAGTRIFLDTVLQGTRLHICLGSRKDINLGILHHKAAAQISRAVSQRDCSCGRIAFWRTDNDACARRAPYFCVG